MEAAAGRFNNQKKGLAITIRTIQTLCFILECGVEKTIRHDKTQ